MKLKYYRSSSLRDNIRWNFLDMKRAVYNSFVRAKYHYNGGYLCHECGVPIPIYYSEIHSKVNGRPFMIANYSKHLVCAHCLAEKIDTFFANADIDDQPCEWFSSTTKTVNVIGHMFGSEKNSELAKDLDLEIRFGSGWWNGQHACNYAFQTALFSDKMYYSTGMSKYVDGKIIMIDRHGIEMERTF